MLQHLLRVPKLELEPVTVLLVGLEMLTGDLQRPRPHVQNRLEEEGWSWDIRIDCWEDDRRGLNGLMMAMMLSSRSGRGRESGWISKELREDCGSFRLCVGPCASVRRKSVRLSSRRTSCRGLLWRSLLLLGFGWKLTGSRDLRTAGRTAVRLFQERQETGCVVAVSAGKLLGCSVRLHLLQTHTAGPLAEDEIFLGRGREPVQIARDRPEVHEATDAFPETVEGVPEIRNQVQREPISDADDSEEGGEETEMQTLRDELHIEEEGRTPGPVTTELMHLQTQDDVFQDDRRHPEDQETPFEGEQDQG